MRKIATVARKRVLQCADLIARNIYNRTLLFRRNSIGSADGLTEQAQMATTRVEIMAACVTEILQPVNNRLESSTLYRFQNGTLWGKELHCRWRAASRYGGGMMIIYAPAAVSHLISQSTLGTHIALGHGVGTQIAVTFALARQHAAPDRLPVRMAVLLCGIVFQTCPHSARLQQAFSENRQDMLWGTQLLTTAADRIFQATQNFQRCIFGKFKIVYTRIA